MFEYMTLSQTVAFYFGIVCSVLSVATTLLAVKYAKKMDSFVKTLLLSLTAPFVAIASWMFLCFSFIPAFATSELLAFVCALALSVIVIAMIIIVAKCLYKKHPGQEETAQVEEIAQEPATEVATDEDTQLAAALLIANTLEEEQAIEETEEVEEIEELEDIAEAAEVEEEIIAEKENEEETEEIEDVAEEAAEETTEEMTEEPVEEEIAEEEIAEEEIVEETQTTEEIAEEVAVTETEETAEEETEEIEDIVEEAAQEQTEEVAEETAEEEVVEEPQTITPQVDFDDTDDDEDPLLKDLFGEEGFDFGEEIPAETNEDDDMTDDDKEFEKFLEALRKRKTTTETDDDENK